MYNIGNFSLKKAKRAISRLFVPAIAIMALVPACSMDEPLEVAASAEASRAIGFHAAGNKLRDTRAAVLETDDVLNFKVLAINVSTSAALNDLNNKTVSRAAVGADWTYSPAQPWPDPGNPVSFFAATTGDASGTTAAPNLTQDAKKAKLTYAIPETATDQRDLLVAVKENEPVPASGTSAAGKVHMYFRHALSRVIVKVKNTAAQDSVLVQEIKLLNLKKEGTLDLNQTNVPDATGTPGAGTQPSGPIWVTSSDASNIKTFAAALPTGGTATVDNDTSDPSRPFTTIVGPGAGAGGADNSLMVMPQTTTLGQSLTNPLDATAMTEFYLYIKASVVDGKGVETIPFKEFYVGVGVQDPAYPGDPTKKLPITFEPGKQYTINVSISAQANFNNNLIVFGDIEVDTWKDGGDIDGQVGANAVSRGDVLQAGNRWVKAVVVTATAAGRPQTILAQLGNLPSATGTAWNAYYGAAYTNFAGWLSNVNNAGGIDATVTVLPTAAQALNSSLSAADASLIESFGVEKNSNGAYYKAVRYWTGSPGNYAQFWNVSGGQSGIQGADAVTNGLGAPVILYMNY